MDVCWNYLYAHNWSWSLEKWFRTNIQNDKKIDVVLRNSTLNEMEWSEDGFVRNKTITQGDTPVSFARGHHIPGVRNARVTEGERERRLFCNKWQFNSRNESRGREMDAWQVIALREGRFILVNMAGAGTNGSRLCQWVNLKVPLLVTAAPLRLTAHIQFWLS